MDDKRRRLRTLTVSALLAAAALVMSFFERLLTAGLPLPPGVKPGFSNIAVMFACAAVGLPCALFIIIIKAGFAFLTAGGVAALLSLCGGLLSALTMFALLKLKRKSMTYAGVSVCGAVAHNLGQLAAASLLVGSALYLSWLPVLLVSGAVFGAVTGVILNAVMPALVNTKLVQ